MHNHKLISKKNTYLSCTSKKIDTTQQSFIYNMSKKNIWATMAYRLMSSLQGGYSNKGVSVVDYKNCQRNLNCFIGGRDSQFRDIILIVFDIMFLWNWQVPL